MTRNIRNSRHFLRRMFIQFSTYSIWRELMHNFVGYIFAFILLQHKKIDIFLAWTSWPRTYSNSVSIWNLCGDFGWEICFLSKERSLLNSISIIYKLENVLPRQAVKTRSIRNAFLGFLSKMYWTAYSTAHLYVRDYRIS